MWHAARSRTCGRGMHLPSLYHPPTENCRLVLKCKLWKEGFVTRIQRHAPAACLAPSAEPSSAWAGFRQPQIQSEIPDLWPAALAAATPNALVHPPRFCREPTHINTYIRLHICTSIHGGQSTYLWSDCISEYMPLYMCTLYIHIYIYFFIYVDLCARMYVCMYVCLLLYACMHGCTFVLYVMAVM